MSIDVSKRPLKRPIIGISLFILSSFFMAFMATTVKVVRSEQSAEAVIFWRNFSSLILILPWFLFANRRLSCREKFHTKQIRIHLIRGISSFTAVYLYFFSLKFLNLSSATLLFNTIPIFIPIVAFVWKRIAIQHVLWWGLGVALLGVIFALDPGKNIINPASILALLSGMIGAVAFVSLRLAHFSENTDRMLFYLFLIGSVCGGVFTLFTFEKSWLALTRSNLFLMILAGVFGFIYQLLITLGAKYVPVRLGSVFIYFSVIFTMIFDKWIWNVGIPFTTTIGFFLIVIGAALLVILYPKEDFKIKEK